MKKISINQKEWPTPIIITAGANYLDIDAYACMVALAELLRLKGENAIAYSNATCNYSICQSLIKKGQIATVLPADFNEKEARYIIVDVSYPDYLQDSVPLDKVVEVYDHHAGFEQYWQDRIGDKTHIEFIGAAATLIYREWKKAGLQDRIKRSTALLLIAAILDNTLNLMSSNTTKEDIKAFQELCQKEKIDEDWCAAYFSEVQETVESDLENALLNDMKTIEKNDCLPSHIAQICVWNTDNLLFKLPQIRTLLDSRVESWMMNVIDVQQRCSYFVCDDGYYQKKIENIFDVCFDDGVAKLPIPYLRKEILKKTKL